MMVARPASSPAGLLENLPGNLDSRKSHRCGPKQDDHAIPSCFHGGKIGVAGATTLRGDGLCAYPGQNSASRPEARQLSGNGARGPQGVRLWNCANRQALGIQAEPIPREWEEVVAACLAKESSQRPQSAGEVAKRLGLAGEMQSSASDGRETVLNVRRGEPIGPRGSPVSPASHPIHGLSRVWSVVFGVLILLLGLAVWYFGVHFSDRKTPQVKIVQPEDERRSKELAAKAAASAAEKAQIEAERLRTEKGKKQQAKAEIKKRADFADALRKADGLLAAEQFAEAHAGYEDARKIWKESPDISRVDAGVQAADKGKNGQQISELMTRAKANDSKENGKIALVALDELAAVLPACPGHDRKVMEEIEKISVQFSIVLVRDIMKLFYPNINLQNRRSSHESKPCAFSLFFVHLENVGIWECGAGLNSAGFYPDFHRG